jgi:PEP-CTERM motif
MAIRLRLQLIAKLIAVVLGLSISCARPVAAADLRVASANPSINKVGIYEFDSSGLLTGGFDLHTSEGNVGAGFFSDFAFDPAGNLWVASANPSINKVGIYGFDSSGLLTGGFDLHTSEGAVGAGFFSDFAFDPAGSLWVASANPSINKVGIYEFDSSGLLTGGFDLHTSEGAVGAGFFSDFAFDPAGNLWVASANPSINKVGIYEFDSSGLLTGGFDLHTSEGAVGAGFFSDFNFAPSAAVPAPEPTTWAMMIIGFSLLAVASWRGAGLRRRPPMPQAG